MFVQNRLGLIESVETMRAQEERMNQIANNLANVDTIGYKRENLTFWEMLHRTESQRMRVGKGIKLLTDFQQGSAQLTGNPLNVMLDGKGFFKVQTPAGIRYTRAGDFSLNGTGQLVTKEGYQVLGEGGTIVVDGSDLIFDRKGGVLVDGQRIDQLQVVDFADPTVLEKEGDNLFRLRQNATGGEIAPEDGVQVIQGSLEQSNANVTFELTEMIDLQRNYQAQQKLVQAIDDIDGQAVNTVGKLS